MIPQFLKERPIIAAALCFSVLVLTTAFYTSPAFEQAAETPQVQIAQSEGFVPLQPLPQPTGSGESDSFVGFLQTLFQLSIIAAGVLAVLMITIAGFEYMGSDKFSTIQKAKSRLWNAVLGLLIVLGAVLILQTINPSITGLDIFSDRQEQAGGEPGQQNGGGDGETEDGGEAVSSCSELSYCSIDENRQNAWGDATYHFTVETPTNAAGRLCAQEYSGELRSVGTISDCITPN